MALFESVLPLEVFHRKYLVEYPLREIWLSEAEARLPSDGPKFYTDGSLFVGRAGSGVFLEELDLKASFALGTFATVFQAEVYTIMVCSDYCLRECMTGKTICICSDSRAALLALSSHTVSSRLMLQCRNSLQGLSNCHIHNRVQLFWVPGHCGMIENEEIDDLAGLGSNGWAYYQIQQLLLATWNRSRHFILYACAQLWQT
jgi:ribonuclease HI